MNVYLSLRDLGLLHVDAKLLEQVVGEGCLGQGHESISKNCGQTFNVKREKKNNYVRKSSGLALSHGH